METPVYIHPLWVSVALWHRRSSPACRFTCIPADATHTGVRFSDCLDGKGVFYAGAEKHGRSYHVFASHAQAGDSSERRQSRMRQFGVIKEFIDSRGLPDTEPVFIAGDLNVDKYNTVEFNQTLGIRPPSQRSATKGLSDNLKLSA